MTKIIETQAATFRGDTVALDETGILSWLHFGDLHITEQHEENYRDFLVLIDHTNTHIAGAVDFAVLPGDNAEKGTEDVLISLRSMRVPKPSPRTSGSATPTESGAASFR
jgi:hypothetical protein